MDYASLVRASHALSSEIELEPLLRRLITIVLQVQCRWKSGCSCACA